MRTVPWCAVRQLCSGKFHFSGVILKRENAPEKPLSPSLSPQVLLAADPTPAALALCIPQPRDGAEQTSLPPLPRPPKRMKSSSAPAGHSAFSVAARAGQGFCHSVPIFRFFPCCYPSYKVRGAGCGAFPRSLPRTGDGGCGNADPCCGLCSEEEEEPGQRRETSAICAVRAKLKNTSTRGDEVRKAHKPGASRGEMLLTLRGRCRRSGFRAGRIANSQPKTPPREHGVLRKREDRAGSLRPRSGSSFSARRTTSGAGLQGRSDTGTIVPVTVTSKRGSGGTQTADSAPRSVGYGFDVNNVGGRVSRHIVGFGSWKAAPGGGGQRPGDTVQRFQANIPFHCPPLGAVTCS